MEYKTKQIIATNSFLLFGFFIGVLLTLLFKSYTFMIVMTLGSFIGFFSFIYDDVNKYKIFQEKGD